MEWSWVCGEREREREREVVGADPRGTDGRRPAPSLPRGVVCTHMHERFSEGGNADFCRFVLICRDPSQQMIYHSPSLLWVCPNHGRKSHQSHYIPTTTASRVHIEYIIPPSTSCHVLCRTLASLVVRAYIAVFHNACYDVIDTNMHVYRNILTATRHERRQVLYSYGSCLKPAGAADSKYKYCLSKTEQQKSEHVQHPDQGCWHLLTRPRKRSKQAF